MIVETLSRSVVGPSLLLAGPLLLLLVLVAVFRRSPVFGIEASDVLVVILLLLLAEFISSVWVVLGRVGTLGEREWSWCGSEEALMSN